jgi:hypothetical protein
VLALYNIGKTAVNIVLRRKESIVDIQQISASAVDVVQIRSC